MATSQINDLYDIYIGYSIEFDPNVNRSFAISASYHAHPVAREYPTAGTANVPLIGPPDSAMSHRNADGYVHPTLFPVNAQMSTPEMVVIISLGTAGPRAQHRNGIEIGGVTPVLTNVVAIVMYTPIVRET